MNRVLLCLALLSFSAFGQSALPKGVTKVTSVEGVTEYRLDNGLRLLLPTRKPIGSDPDTRAI